MLCALRKLPVTDFMSDHPFAGMSGINSPSPHLRRDERFPNRSALPSREPSKEDMEFAQHLLGHSQGARNSEQQRQPQRAADSPSPASDRYSPVASLSAQRMGQITPRSASTEGNQREQSQPYAPMTSLHSDAVPSGQVCR